MHVLYSFPYRLGKTGVGLTAWQQVRWLSLLGIKLTVFCGSLERPLPAAVDVRTSIATGKLKIPFRALGLLLAPRIHDVNVAWYIKQSQSGIDLIHGWPLGSERSFTEATSKGIITVLENCNSHIRNLIALVGSEYDHLCLEKKPPYLTDKRWLSRHEQEYGLVDYFACPSDFVRKSFIDYGYPLTKLLPTQYGYDNDIIHLGMQDTRHQFRVAFLGRVEPRKGLHYLLTAWKAARLPSHARLYIAGTIEAGYREVLEPLAQQESVTFLGFVDEPFELLRRADVLVLPSVEEGSALVSYEARGAGCVILASTASGAVGQDDDGVLFHRPGDTEALRAQLEKLANDPAEYIRIRERGKNHNHRLTWKYAAHVLADHYKGVLRRKGAA